MNKGITIKGKYADATVYAKAVEAGCENMIQQYLDNPISSGVKVRVMPDVHVGKGVVIGFTSTYNQILVPSTIGVDIGCGVCAYNIGKGKLKFDKLDEYIRKNIPAGFHVRSSIHEKLEKTLSITESTYGFKDIASFTNTVRDLSIKQDGSFDKNMAALGTLGGGNHFIEVDQDESGNRWLLIHSGSRNLGLRTYEYHQEVAIRYSPKENPIKCLIYTDAENYINDMIFVQHYAKINRALMASSIIEDFFKIPIEETEKVESVHNYLDTLDSIIRKGAISAHEGEKVVIPFSMSEGAIIGKGKGNPEWNYSAPHGSGRKVARSQAKSGLSLDEFRKQMKGIWSSTVGKDTLDESPMAYKRPKDILDYLDETVEIQNRLKTFYNFKSTE